MSKQQPTRRQSAALRDQRARAEVRRDLRENHARRAMARIMQFAKRRRKTAVVPVGQRPIEYLVEHTQPNRAWFRSQGVKGGSGNRPYVNPDRDGKSARSGRLRKELR